MFKVLYGTPRAGSLTLMHSVVIGNPKYLNKRGTSLIRKAVSLKLSLKVRTLNFKVGMTINDKPYLLLN